MDPVSIVIAALALLACKAGESIASEAGRAGWIGVERLAGLAKKKLSRDPEGQQTLDDFQDDPNEQELVVALKDALNRNLENDAAFRSDILAQYRRLLAESLEIGQALKEIATQIQEVTAQHKRRSPPHHAPESVSRTGRIAGPISSAARQGGALSFGEAKADLANLASDSVDRKMELCAQLIAILDESTARLRHHLEGIPDDRLLQALGAITRAVEHIKDAEKSISASQEHIMSAIRS